MDIVTITNIALVGILFIGTAVGFAKGFLEQALELVGVVGALVLAILLGGLLASLLEKQFGLPYSPALVIASITLFFSGLVLTHFVAKGLGKVVKMTLLGWVDRFAGGALGLVLAMIIASLLITVTLELPLPRETRQEVRKASVSLFLRPIAGQVFNFVVAHGPKAIHFEEIFKKSDSI